MKKNIPLMVLLMISASSAYGSEKPSSGGQLRLAVTEQYLKAKAACGAQWARVGIGAVVESLPVAGFAQILADRLGGNKEFAVEVFERKALNLPAGGMLCEVVTGALGFGEWITEGQVSAVTKDILKNQCYYRTKRQHARLIKSGQCQKEEDKLVALSRELARIDQLHRDQMVKDARLCHLPSKSNGLGDAHQWNDSTRPPASSANAL